jgi:hypothetical protein
LTAPLDIPARLDEMRLLRDGWLEGSGKGPSHEGLDWLARAFSQFYPDDLPLPFLYPTAEGAVQAEWTLGPAEITLEIDLETRRGNWHALNTETDAEAARELNLGEANDWRCLTAEIQREWLYQADQ